MEITNVGLAMDTLETKDGIIKGRGTIYSKDEEGLELEYCDNFTFEYSISGGFATLDLDDSVFGGYRGRIARMLIDNLQTNYLQTN